MITANNDILDNTADKSLRDFQKTESAEKPQYILLEKTKALYTMLHPLMDMFPNTAKFTLRARIEETLLDAITFQVMQNYRQKDEERRELMLNILARLNILSVLLQQAAIFKYISYSQHEKSEGLLKELVAISNSRYRNLGGGVA